MRDGQAFGSCKTAGKRTYLTRQTARNALRRAHPGEKGMRPYKCDGCDLWHLGHLPERVLSGDIAAADHYQQHDGGDPR